MDSSSEIFSQYESEYSTLYESINTKLSSLSSISQSQEPKKLLINQLSRELEEIDEIIGTMEIELNTLASVVRNTLNPRVKAYKEDVKKLKKTFQSYKLSAANERDQLLGSTVVDFNSKTQDQRNKVLDGTDRLTEGSRRLEEARRVALDTEQIGISTLEDLNRQRQQLERVDDSLNAADSWIAKSQGVLRNMQKTLQTNKMLQYGLVGVLIITIVIIVFFRFFG